MTELDELSPHQIGERLLEHFGHASHVDGLWWFETPKPRRFFHRHSVHTTYREGLYDTERCACGAIQFSDMPGWVKRGQSRFRSCWRL